MKTRTSLFVFFLTFTLTGYAQARLCRSPWKSQAAQINDCTFHNYTTEVNSLLTGRTFTVKVSIRSGYLPENPAVPFRGNIIYYEGLGDSMLNHKPLFHRLTTAGFRVISFDYMGQGGSSGSMNNTRILDIPKLGNEIWNAEARDLNQFPQKIIVGWSTGGLAAYSQAMTDRDVNHVVLIAPGIVPRLIVGKQEPLFLKFNQITLSTLTTAVYPEGSYNPHVDPIKPSSPLQVKSFAADLVKQSLILRTIPMPQGVKGFVLLSGNNDTYVNAQGTLDVLKEQGIRFKTKQYPGSLHEIDNEADPNGVESHTDILNFLSEDF